MVCDGQERFVTIAGDAVGIVTNNTPTMNLYIGEAAASFAGDAVGYGVGNASAARFEVVG
jgi:hypothetical protein